MRFSNKIYLDYNDVLSMCCNLEHSVSAFKPDIIVGITRGGLLPAVHLSHALNVEMITLQWQTRDDSKREYNTQLQTMINRGKRVAFVDDINDTGKTFSTIHEKYTCTRPNVTFVSLVAKTDSEFLHNTHASLTINDPRWIVFPWENAN